MSLENVKSYLDSLGIINKLIELSDSSATVEQAAGAIGCEPQLIAKTLSFYISGSPVLIVTSGDAKIDNRKYRDEYREKARMIPFHEVEDQTGHAPGGVCPFAVNPNVRVYLDVSLKRFDHAYPAAGSGNSAVKMTIGELEKYSNHEKWVDVCKGWYGEQSRVI